jgi:hypothetical protein
MAWEMLEDRRYQSIEAITGQALWTFGARIHDRKSGT